MNIQIGQKLLVEYPPHGTYGKMLVTSIEGDDIIIGFEFDNQFEGRKCWTYKDCVIKIIEKSNFVNWLETLNEIE